MEPHNDYLQEIHQELLSIEHASGEPCNEPFEVVARSRAWSVESTRWEMHQGILQVINQEPLFIKHASASDTDLLLGIRSWNSYFSTLLSVLVPEKCVVVIEDR